VSELSLAVEIREQTGKGAARKMRAAGRIPGVVYSRGEQTVSLSLNPAELEKLLKTGDAGLNTLFSLRGDARVEGRTVLIKELQREPVKGSMMHLDLFEVDLAKRISVSVPVHTNGIPVGVTLGGILEHLMREIEMDCLPGAIPNSIEIDVSGLDIGDSIHVSEIDFPEGVEVHAAGELPVVSVVVLKVQEEEEEAEVEVEGEGEGVEEGAEGEVSEEGKGEEEDDAKDKRDSKDKKDKKDKR